MTIGELLNDARKKAGLTVQEISDKLNISRELWNKMISGERRFQTELIPKICEILPLDGATILIALGVCVGVEYDEETYLHNFLQGETSFIFKGSQLLLGKADAALLALIKEYCDIAPDDDDPRLLRIITDLQSLRGNNHKRNWFLGENKSPTENDMKVLEFLTRGMDTKHKIVIGTNAIAEGAGLSYRDSAEAFDRLETMNYLSYIKTAMPGEPDWKEFHKTHDPENYEYNEKMIIEMLRTPDGEYYYDGWPQISLTDIHSELSVYPFPKGDDAACRNT